MLQVVRLDILIFKLEKTFNLIIIIKCLKMLQCIPVRLRDCLFILPESISAAWADVGRGE